ncbi:MAG: sigma-70 family RNA polymerase sigma factor [Actinomycetota bacterium]|nr:sigma-70 family RNA polymerase sigma factor [Actinomycetota bacterium]
MSTHSGSDFASFYEETADATFRFAFLVAGDAGEDLAAEAYARALARWEDVSGYERQDAWLRRVLLNLVASRARRERVQKKFLATRAPKPDIARESRMSEERILLRQALDELSPRQRAVVVLRYVDDLPVKEVAGALGCSVSSVNAHLKRALPKLQTRLGSLDRDEGSAGGVFSPGSGEDSPPPNQQRRLGTSSR